MSLSTGSRLGPYEIHSALGAGGMGEVYKARDTRLDRTVAIKVLPAALALDSGFRARFDREARAISQLSHPNICTLYDVGEHEGCNFLVMEHLEGETLGARLERGPLRTDEAVRLGIEIAQALAAAHRAGIIHRDLKPANVVLVRNTGGSDGSTHAKLLDFGLAKSATAFTSIPGAEGLTVQPTVAGPLTQQGTIIGTFQYMAPEQIEGGEADVRSDIWAFGCVLYEMLTGTRAFGGKSHASLLANILHVDPPPISEHQPLVSAPLTHVVQRCLEKDPDARWQTIADVARELRWASAAGDQRGSARVGLQRYSLAAWVAGAALSGAAVTMLMTRSAPSPGGPSVPPMKLSILAPANVTMTPFGSAGIPHYALSPDGRQIAFVASAAGRSPSLWVRPLESRGAREIPGSDDASSPFWSSDSGSLGFFADGKLKTIGLNGERPSTIATLLDAAGATWNGDVILVGRGTSPIMRIAASGGAMTAATTLRPTNGDRRILTLGQRWPQFLPDGRHFIYTETAGSVMLGSLDSTGTSPLLETQATAVYAGEYLFFVPPNSSKLMAQRVDPTSFKPVGAAREMLDQVAYAAGSGFPPVSVSANGLLAYWDGTTAVTTPEWFDRRGNPLPTLPAPSQTHTFAISPDGRRVAFVRTDGIWLMESTGAMSRFTFNNEGATTPIWSADGRDILFTSTLNGVLTLFRRASSGEQERPVGTIPGTKGLTFGNYRATDWSHDGRTALISISGEATNRDIAAFSIDTGQVTPLVQSVALEVQGRFSPDKRLFAYASNETGRWEIFVETFPRSGPRWQVSTDGGSQPVWRRDGKELYFIAPDRKLMAVSVTPGSTFKRDIPRPLFETRMRPTYAPYPVNYDVTADGERFLIDVVRPDTGPNISLVLNWTAALR
jgi:serine/threonine protein kinase